MLSKKVIIPLFILSLLVTTIFIGRTDTTTLSSKSGSTSAEVMQLQETLNNKEGLIESRTKQALDLSTKTNKELAQGQAPTQVQVPAPASTSASPSDSKSAPTKIASTPAAKSTSTVSRSGSASSRGVKTISMVATGYDGCYECNKPYYGYPSYIGLPLARGIVAVDPKVIPMGTKLYVEGYGEAIAADQGNAIKGNRIDLFFNTHQQALNWGMKTVKVTILGK